MAAAQTARGMADRRDLSLAAAMRHDARRSRLPKFSELDKRNTAKPAC